MPAILFYILFFLLFSCNEIKITEDIFNKIEVQKKYQPLILNNYTIYQVEKKIYHSAENFTIEQYLLKESIEDTLMNLQDTIFIIKTYKKSSTDIDWQTQDVSKQYWKERKLIKTEKNGDIIKLMLPIVTHTEWDANLYNRFATELFTITKVSQPDSMVTVLQRDNKSLIKKSYSVEYFVYNIGLVEKYVEEYTYITDTENADFAKDVIVRGEVYKQTFLEKGKNKD